LAALLADQPGCQVVGQVASEADLPDALEVHRPQVVLWDLGWDPASNLERLGDLAEVAPPIVALLPDQSLATDAVALGARGLLLRETTADPLVAALTAAAQGLVAFDPSLAPLASVREGQALTTLIEPLTPRELEVLQLLAEGLPNKAIARRLDISEHTVKFHVNAILGKLGAQSRTEAVVRATRMGLILL